MRFWVIALALAGLFTWQHRVDVQNWISPPKPLVFPAGYHVALYGTKWCGYCAQTRRLFEARKVPYQEYDIEESKEAAAEFDRLSGDNVPLIVIQHTVIHGFDEEAINTELSKL